MFLFSFSCFNFLILITPYNLILVVPNGDSVVIGKYSLYALPSVILNLFDYLYYTPVQTLNRSNSFSHRSKFYKILQKEGYQYSTPPNGCYLFCKRLRYLSFVMDNMSVNQNNRFTLFLIFTNKKTINYLVQKVIILFIYKQKTKFYM